MNNNLHMSIPFLLKMAQRNIASFFNSPSGYKRSSIASDSELGDQNELTVSVTMSTLKLRLRVQALLLSSMQFICNAECCQMHYYWQAVYARTPKI